MKRFLLYFILGFLVSCEQKKETNDVVYFAGEIVNPTNDYVVLYKDDTVLDSAKLDSNNRFSFTLNKIDEGLHHFNHTPQFQYVYLEKGDSLIIRLNTVAFDESLVFSGSNEEINNFLLEMFLNYEDEEQLVNSYYQLKPEAFSLKIDSLRTQKLNELKSLENNEFTSHKAYKIAKASIDYNSYIHKEKYPFIHKRKTDEEIIHELDSDFYNYRKQLDYNSKDLTFFRPYYNYVNHHFGNLSFMSCVENCTTEKMTSTKGYLHLNKHKMVLIDSLIKEQNLRNNLFRNVAMDYLLKVHEVNSASDEFIAHFQEYSSNETHTEEIKNLYKNIKGLQPNQNIPDIALQKVTGDVISMKGVSKDKKTIFYFWSGDQKRHFRNITKQVQKLKILHPENQYVGVNVRTSKEKWLSIIDKNAINSKNQYRIADFKTTQELLMIDNLNKSIVTNDTLIVDAFSNIFLRQNNKHKKALIFR